MDWSLAITGGGLVLAVLSAWGGAAFAAGRAAGATDLKVSEAETRLRAHVDARLDKAFRERRDELDKALRDRRAEMDKLWERTEHAADMQSNTNAQLAAIQATLKHIEMTLERLGSRFDAAPARSSTVGGDD